MRRRVEVRGIRRQPLDPEPPVTEQGLAGPAVDRPPILYHEHRPSQSTLHLAEERLDLLGRYVLFVRRRRLLADLSPNFYLFMCFATNRTMFSHRPSEIHDMGDVRGRVALRQRLGHRPAIVPQFN